MTRTLRRLAHDTDGGIQPAAYLLMVTLLVLAALPGLVTVRDTIVQEFGDAAAALDNLDQSYSFTLNGQTSVFIDSSTLDDPADAEPAGISVRLPASPEN